jgi:hypothetical protein
MAAIQRQEMPVIMRATQSIICSSALLLMGSTSVLAVEAQPFAERLSSILEKQNLSIAYTGAEERGDDVVLEGVTFSVGDESVEAGDLVFEGVTGSQEEGYEITRFSTELERDTGASSWSVQGFVLEGVELAGTRQSSTVPTASEIYWERATLDEMQTTNDGEVAFRLNGAEISNEFGDGEILTTRFDLGTFTITPGAGEEAETFAEKLDYDELSGTLTGGGSWNAQTGDLEIEQVKLSLEDAGTLTFSESITGYTPDFIQSVVQLQERMANQPDNSEAWTAATLGLISQLNLANLEVTYEDASLTDRILEHYASLSGQSREQLVATLEGMLPPMLGGLQNQELQNEIATALSRFLKDPTSISLSLDPAQPVPAPQILGAALGAPATLPDILNLSVTAGE